MSSPSEPAVPRGPTLTRPETSILVRDALARDANDVDALFVLAALRVQDGYPEEGLSILDRVLKLNPDYPGAWFFKERIHRIRGETPQAESAHLRGETREG